MNGDNPRDSIFESERSLDPALEDFVDHLRKGRAECPSDEVLADFACADQEQQQAMPIRLHIDTCPWCEMKLNGWDASIAKARSSRTTDATGDTVPGWREIEERGWLRFRQFLESERPTSAPGPKGRAIRWSLARLLASPALAYILVLALVYPAYLGIRRGYLSSGKRPAGGSTRQMPSSANPPASGNSAAGELPNETSSPASVAAPKSSPGPGARLSIATPVVIDLRSAERGMASAEPVVRPVPGQRVFALSFLFPISEKSVFEYNIEIRNSKGELSASEKGVKARDWLGNFLIVCNSDLFPPDHYELRIVEKDRESGAVRRESSYPFRVESSNGRSADGKE